MIGVGAFLGVLLVLILLCAIAVPGKIFQPLKWEWKAAPLEHLSDGDSRRLESWSRELEELGYLFVGDFRKEAPPPPPSATRSIEQIRVWISADRRSWAFGTHIATFSIGDSVSVARTVLVFGFLSRSTSGKFLQTHNYPKNNRFEQDPAQSYRRLAGLDTAWCLSRAHQEHVEGQGPMVEYLETEFPAAWKEQGQREQTSLIERGYLKADGDHATGTSRLGRVTMGLLISPFWGDGGPAWKVWVKLLAGAASGIGAALLLPAREVWPVVLFLASAVYAAAAFPNTCFFSWIYVALPAHVYFEWNGRGSWIPWAAGFLAVTLLGMFVERWRYDRIVRRYQRKP